MVAEGFDFIKKMLDKHKAIQSADSVEGLRGLLDQAIKESDRHSFISLCGKFAERPEPDSALEPWMALFKSNNLSLLQRLDINQNDDIKHMEDAFAKYSQLEDVPHDEQFNQLKWQVRSTTSQFYGASARRPDECIIQIGSKTDNKGYPDIIVDTEQAVYRFSGLDRQEVAKKGLFACLKEKADIYTEDLNKRRKAFYAGDEEALSDEEVIRFSQNDDTPMQDIDSFSKQISQVDDICKQFNKTSHAPLLDLFTKEGKAIGVSYRKTKRIGGLSAGEAVVLDQLTVPTLHHELVHAFDNDTRFSTTPVFKKVYEFCGDEFVSELLRNQETSGFFCALQNRCHGYPENKKPIEMPAYMASLSYESKYNKPPIVNSVLNFISAYAKAVLSGDKMQQKKVEKALSKGADDIVSDDLPRYLNKLTKSLSAPVADRKRQQER